MSHFLQWQRHVGCWTCIISDAGTVGRQHSLTNVDTVPVFAAGKYMNYVLELNPLYGWNDEFEKMTFRRKYDSIWHGVYRRFHEHVAKCVATEISWKYCISPVNGDFIKKFKVTSDWDILIQNNKLFCKTFFSKVLIVNLVKYANSSALG